MANFDGRVIQNARGQFYVDYTCIFCGLCTEIAPSVFREHQFSGWAYVSHQPTTEEEIKKAIESVDACPTESIGADGLQFDWDSGSPYYHPDDPTITKAEPSHPANPRNAGG